MGSGGRCTDLEEWQVRALQRSAWSRDGAVSAALGLELDGLVTLARRALSEWLERPLRVEALEQDAPRGEGAWGVEWRSAGGDETVLVTMDREACRALVDAAHARLGAPRGAGLLTDTEAGVLEYLALELFCRIEGQVPERISGAAVARFLDRGAVRLAEREGGRFPFPWRLCVGGQCGTFTAWAAARPRAARIALAPPSAAPREADRVTATLALPRIRLAREEADRLRPGDVVLAGIADRIDSALGCDLVTHTGWWLARGVVASDSASFVQADLRPREPSAYDLALDEARGCELLPTIGEVELDLDSIRTWREGRRVGLRKPPGALIALCAADRCWAGEPVRVNGELGIRLLEDGGA